MKVLEITPYEPPASGWVTRVKMLRRAIEARGGICEILDIGPSRRIERPGCVTVMSGADYVSKLVRFAKRRFAFHCHINAEYFRGLLLALAACLVARVFLNRCVTTFHAGAKQPFLRGWRSILLWPLFWVIFRLSHAVVCNSEEVRQVLRRYVSQEKVSAIPAFSAQYMQFEVVDLGHAIDTFLAQRDPLISTYLCFRDGFYLDVVVEALHRLRERHRSFGLVLVGTGDERAGFEAQLAARNLTQNVFLAGDLSHDQFMTLISRSTIHLRTPTTDGVSSTVLQALSLSVPVVASENGTRPDSVLTYKATDAGAMIARIESILSDRARSAAAVIKPEVRDTVNEEVDLLLGPAILGCSAAAGTEGAL